MIYHLAFVKNGKQMIRFVANLINLLVSELQQRSKTFICASIIDLFIKQKKLSDEINADLLNLIDYNSTSKQTRI